MKGGRQDIHATREGLLDVLDAHAMLICEFPACRIVEPNGEEHRPVEGLHPFHSMS